MRLDDLDPSKNVDDLGTSRGGGGFSFGGGGLPIGRGGLGLGGIAVLVVVGLLFGINPLALLGGGDMSTAPGERRAPVADAAQACAADANRMFSCRVLTSTEDTWGRLFAQQGAEYQPPMLHFYTEQNQSGCGAAQAAMGPFYCPSDQGVYLDTAFFDELSNRFHAAGDFAQAYVIAHEVGHHVQYLTGIADKVRQQQANASATEGNALQVRMELQADCYAGVWAGQNRDRIEPGDVEEGMRAANAIGDDTLQREAGQRVAPDSFTHGTSAQRMKWLRTGIESADPATCDTFSGAI